MEGFLGTTANLKADLTLVATIVLGIVAAFGGIQAKKNNFSKHCPVMAIAVLLNWIPVLLGMIPMWVVLLNGTQLLATGLFSFYSVPIFHGILGGVAQILMTYTVVRMLWIKTLPPKNTIWLMRIAILMWFLAILGGVAVYVVSYIIQ